MKIAALIAAVVALETAAFAQPTAEDLHAEGQAAYDRTDYATAITKWQASYDLSNESGLLFNLAQAKRLSGDCSGAIATYRKFVAADPDKASEPHKLADDFMRALEGTCKDPKPVATPPKVIEAPKLGDRSRLNSVDDLNGRKSDHSRPGRTWKISGLVTAGAGTVTLAIGLGLGHRGSSIGDEITTACSTTCDWGSLKAKDARGRRYVTIGRTLNVIGTTAIAGGAVFYYLGIRQEAITIAPAARDGGAVLSWNGAW